MGSAHGRNDDKSPRPDLVKRCQKGRSEGPRLSGFGPSVIFDCHIRFGSERTRRGRRFIWLLVDLQERVEIFPPTHACHVLHE